MDFLSEVKEWFPHDLEDQAWGSLVEWINDIQKRLESSTGEKWICTVTHNLTTKHRKVCFTNGEKTLFVDVEVCLLSKP